MNTDQPPLPLNVPPARCDWRPQDRRRVIDHELGLIYERRCALSRGHDGNHLINWHEIDKYFTVRSELVK